METFVSQPFGPVQRLFQAFPAKANSWQIPLIPDALMMGVVAEKETMIHLAYPLIDERTVLSSRVPRPIDSSGGLARFTIQPCLSRTTNACRIDHR